MSDTHLGPYRLGPHDTQTWGVVTGDARELAAAIPDESVDLIFTDPVYDRMDDYRWLAETAGRVLRADRACLVWCGIGYLDGTIAAMSAGGLSYRWQAVLYYRNREKPLHCDMGYSKWASLLWFERGRVPARRTVDLIGVNVFANNGADVLWDWGKPAEPMAQWLDAFTAPSALVFDPFTGGGTVPAVCRQLNRRWLAFEIDPDTAERARERIANTQPPLPGLVVEQKELGL